MEVMPYLFTKDGRLFYSYHPAPGATQNLVLLHGAGGSHLVWPAELRRMSKTNVYALDLPGHGRSSSPGRDSVDEYANDVIVFLEALDFSNVVLLGHSMGGAIAQFIGIRNHPAVVALILLGTGARLRVTDSILGQILADFEATVSQIVEYCWAEDAPHELKSRDRENVLQIDPQVLYGDYLACDRFDLMSRLGEILVPTLVISGTADVMTPVRYGRYLAENIVNARFVVIENGGHQMALEQPKAVADAVETFLNELRSGSGKA